MIAIVGVTRKCVKAIKSTTSTYSEKKSALYFKVNKRWKVKKKTTHKTKTNLQFPGNVKNTPPKRISLTLQLRTNTPLCNT